jgi:SNF2 family DNA or RNA helicase
MTVDEQMPARIRRDVDGEVRVAASHDRILIVPRPPGAGLELASALREELPNLRLTATRGLVTVGAADCPVLLSASAGLRWEQDALVFAENRAAAPVRHAQVRAAVGDVASGRRKRASELLAGIPGLNVLDDHQWEAVAAMTTPGGYGLCLFDEQGTGKTVTLIHAFDVLVARHEADVLLIIAPKAMVGEWVRDFRRFKRELYVIRTLTGTAMQKRQSLAAGGDIFITNYETAVTMEAELRLFLRGHRQRAVLAIDESYNVKNTDARRTQALRRLREWCGRAYVLCGTPAPNSAHDIVEQVSLVDFGSTFGAVKIPPDRTSARPIIRQVLQDSGAYIRNLKAEVLPWLPKKRFHRVTVPMEPIQQNIYAEAVRGLLKDVRTADQVTFRRTYAGFLARRAALLQICSHPRGVADGYSEVPAKLLVLDALLDAAVTQRSEKVVIWSSYRASIDAIVLRYSHHGVVRYDGTITGVDERSEAVRRFQEDQTTMLFIGNPAAAGAGLTLHAARLSIYESLSTQAAHYLQSIDRIHRRGQLREVEYFVLLCESSLELTEYDRLVGKEAAGQDLLGDSSEPPVTRETMIAELEHQISLLG